MAVSTTSAASSTCSSASSLSIPDVKLFLSPTVENRSVRLSRRSFGVNSFSRRSIQLSYRCIRLQNRARAVKGETTVIEERESQLLRELNGNGAASSNGSKYGVNGSSSNGRLGVVGSEMDGGNNGSLTKYVNGNGSASADEKAAEAAEDGRKKRIEEVGKEDAWFKGASNGKVEVSVVPGGRWNRFKTYSTIRRTLEIWGNVFAFIFKVWLNNQKFSYRGGMTEEKKIVRRKALAKWLKESILRLGPTFIKIGQQFSTRVDILAQEYVDQLSELQDQVPPFPSETALSIVEEELGAPVEDIFDRFDYEPIAAASLGQVHRARLKGQEVVLKVQRPGLKDLFDIDLKNLRVIAEYLQKVDPKSDGAKRDWVAIYDECANVLYQEIDYTKEAANAEQFANNFKDMAYVKVPNIVWEYTTPQHPGNIAVDDVNGGRLIFYDFGMMGSISPNIREGLLEVFYGVYEKDSDKVLQAMVQMGVLVPTGDMTAVRRTAQFFLNSFEERLAAQRREREIANAELGFKKPLSKEEKLEKKKQRLAAIGEDLLSIAGDQPFRFPATFTFVVRAFSVLDGIGKGLDPRFDITEIAKPYALELLKFREAGVEVVVKDLRNRWDRQSRAFFNLFRQADRVEKLAETIQRLEQGDLKLRVRTLEAERAFQRVAAVQTTVGSAVAAGSLVNLATILYLNAMRVPATLAYAVCAIFTLKVVIGIVKVKKLDQRERLITGTA
ncbi:Protein ACTIVITY OF BC1 COMPLEX KINASE 8, chloroplastic [Linum grandiflorum]